ncbi:MAG: hypothetical protein HQK92_08280 [Nitrospirae bacterium]|nr:hypothetical protein [Nitrospirota bacterium]
MEKEKKKIPCPARMAIEGLEKAFTQWGIEHAEKQACWQFTNCPANIYLRCPAFTGHAGRRCWLMAGSFSGKNPYCIHSKKLKDCTECSFYKEVKNTT